MDVFGTLFFQNYKFYPDKSQFYDIVRIGHFGLIKACNNNILLKVSYALVVNFIWG